jgi:hypothetical protein
MQRERRVAGDPAGIDHPVAVGRVEAGRDEIADADAAIDGAGIDDRSAAWLPKLP